MMTRISMCPGLGQNLKKNGVLGVGILRNIYFYCCIHMNGVRNVQLKCPLFLQKKKIQDPRNIMSD